MINNTIERIDIVEDFAKQLNELCAKTRDLNASDDEDVHYDYEQLPEDDDENIIGAAEVDSDSDEIDQNEYVTNVTLKEDEILCNSTTPIYDLTIDGSNAACSNEDHLETKLPDVTPLMLSLDPKESIPEETSTLIMDIMKKCHLPENAIPDWAKSIPETSWMPKMDTSNTSN